MKRLLAIVLFSCAAFTESFAMDPALKRFLQDRPAASPLGPSQYGNIFEFPHSATYDIGCESCHYAYHPILPPDWATFVPTNIDDTLYNDLCRHCHNDVVAPFAKTHSSLSTDGRYGDWSLECIVCHEPHVQAQAWTFGSGAFTAQGTVFAIMDNWLQCAGAAWPDNQFRGLSAYPNVVREPLLSYKILANSADRLYLEGPVDLGRAAAGDTFAVVYGKSINASVSTPSSGRRTVRFFRAAGSKSFADGDASYDGICEVCHTVTPCFRNGPGGSSSHMAAQRCTPCHPHAQGFKASGSAAHVPHLPLVTCQTGNLGCHGAAEPPLLADGRGLSTTAACNNCHSASGAATAKTYWDNVGTPGSWRVSVGEAAFCGSCHNPTSPGYTQMGSGGDRAPDIEGNGTTYGFRATGHGKTSGSYARLSWQSGSATGNPAANRVCSSCHDLAAQHFGNPAKRLKSGFENDGNNSNCRQCHDPGTVAVAAPPWYTTYAAFQASAHGSLKCTDCHEPHGASGANVGMARGNRQALCLQAGCHVGMAGHALGMPFARGGQGYTLECVSCHNVHLVTGPISASDTTRTPLTRIDNNLLLWGGAAGQKMSDFAGSGIYRTPNGDTLTGAQLPDYPTFCLQCHGQNMSPSIHGNISWDDMHGRGAAGSPNDYNSCPNWFDCGHAYGWDGDDCTGGDNVCWPVMSKGFGDECYSRLPYNHAVRVANGNFVLSCSDCHATHAVSSGAWKVRGTINGGGITSEWKTICNACHYYYMVRHAGMSCGGNNSCHDTNVNPRFGTWSESIHGMPNGGGGGGRAIDNTLVLDLRFENNLNDSGSFVLHSKWFANAGTFAAGKVGQAITLNNVTDNNHVQVGTTNQYWSTDDGNHGTWRLTEMKYNTTLQAWVRPTDNAATEMILFTKSVGINDGGYQFLLKKIGGTALRAAFNIAADNNGFAQGGKAGIRGAYSSVTIPLNVWTHVAATFDRNGPDRNPSDRSAGRIRIYVNGIDVTTSDATGNNVQPGAGETSIYAYSENSPWNESICYNGNWCASEFLIGGFPWSANGFTGSIDEAKVWNVTKDNSYFAAFDSQAGPYLSTAEGQYSSNQLTVVFSEGVYTNSNQTGSLVPGDFVLTDADNGRTITGVSHAAGSAAATLTLSSPLDASNDINVDTLGLAANAVYDRYGVAGTTAAVTISGPQTCPTGQVVFNLNETAGSAFAFDNSMLLAGTVNDPADTLRGDGLFFGDAANNYISFVNNQACLQATTNLTLEARIKPTGLAGTTTYARRIFAKDNANNYQLSVWRNNATAAVPNFNAPAGRASIAFWLNPVDVHGGNAWKVVLTDHSLCPVVSDHWYVVRLVWNSSKPGGVPGQPFVPADIYIEDQGTLGTYNDNLWAGSVNCTKADQGYHGDNNVAKVYTGDVINPSDGPFSIGVNAPATGNHFNGWIDWIRWDASANPPGRPGFFDLFFDLDADFFFPAP